MTKAHELERSKQTADTASRDADAIAPGRIARSAALLGPNGPMPSGLIQRKARDANGVEDGAGDAVARAASSSGVALPETLMRKFESSLGADLSSVRVHTGAQSADAASAVGAKAYTLGQDIHFGAGHFDPSSQAGEHLLAHEVAHTVQQRGGVARMQLKPEVSSPGDAFEVEADVAADAMVAGRAASISGASGVMRVVMRAPNSYSGQDGGISNNPVPKGTGVSSEADAQKAELSKTVNSMKSSALGKSAAMLVKASGLNVDPGQVAAHLQELAVKKNQPFIDKLEAELTSRNGGKHWLLDNRSNPKVGIEVPDGKRTKIVTETQELENQLKHLRHQSSLFYAITGGAKIASVMNGRAQTILGAAAKVNAQLMLLKPETFSKAEDATRDIEAVLHVIDDASEVMDTTALKEFQSNPSFDTAKAWGEKVGNAFAKLAPIGQVLGKVVPGGDVIGGDLMLMPAAVIAQFTKVVEDYYQNVDDMTRENCPSEMLGPGEEGQTCGVKKE